MPFYTAEEVKELEKTSRGRRLNCGWNIPPAIIAKMACFINDWQPKSKVEQRDKLILQLVFIENMNAAQIARLQLPELISYSNNSKGQPLSHRAIGGVVYKYAPEMKDRPRHKQSKKRNELFADRLSGKVNRPKVCSTCGSKKGLELHHIIPLAKGGNNEYYNLIYLCHDCHRQLHSYIYASL